MADEASFGATRTLEALLKQLKRIDTSKVPPRPIPRVATGILSLDMLFGGGIPMGKMIEIFGPENSGKSTIGTMILPRAYVDQGKYVAIFDSEKSFDLDYARKWNFDPEAVDEKGRSYVDIFRTQTAEQWFDALLYTLGSDLYDLVVVDSFAKFAPRVEAESPIDKGTMGVFPRMAARFWRVLGSLDYRATLLILNQERLDIGNANVYTGAPKVSPGGKSTKHESTVKIRMMAPQDQRVGDKITGIVLRMKVEKSKIFTPDVKAVNELHILIEGNMHDVDRTHELYTAAKRLGVLRDKAGNPYEKRTAYFEGEAIADGEAAILERLDSDPSLASRITESVLEANALPRGRENTEIPSEPVEGDVDGDFELVDPTDFTTSLERAARLRPEEDLPPTLG